MSFPSFRLEVVRSLLKLDPTENHDCNNDSPTRLVGRHFSIRGTEEAIVHLHGCDWSSLCYW